MQTGVTLEEVVVIEQWILRLLELTFLSFVTQLQDGIIELPPLLKEKTLERGSCAVNTVDVI